MIRITFGKLIINRLHQELIRANSQNNAQHYRRVCVLLCYARGMSMEEIMEIFRIARRTVYQWLSEFIIKGFGWFKTLFKGRGRKPRLTKEQRAKLKEIIKCRS